MEKQLMESTMNRRLKRIFLALVLPALWLMFDAHDVGGLLLIVLFSWLLWRRVKLDASERTCIDDQCLAFCVLAFFLGHLIYFAINKFVMFPLVDAGKWLPWLRSALRPEPAESLSWVASLAVLPVLAMILRVIRFPCYGSHVSGLVLFGVLFWLVVGRCRTSTYCELWNLPVLLVLVYVILFVWMWRRANQNEVLFGRLADIFVWLALAAASSTHLLSTWDPCLRFTHMDIHMGMIYHQLALDAKGVFEFHQYGFYHLWLKYIFDLIGYTVPTISCVMACLLMLSALAFVSGVRRMIEKRWLVLFFAMSFVCCWPESFGHNIYWQYNPIRTFFPMLVIWLWSRMAMRTFTIQKKDLIALAVLSSVSMFWNLDYGIVAFVSSVVFAACLELVNFSSWRKPLQRGGLFVAFVCGTIAVGYAFIAVQSGNAHWLVSSFEFQKTFYGSGYYMLPIGNVFMSDAWAVLLIYSMGFWKGLNLMFDREKIKAQRGVFLFSLSVMAFGMMTYYQGRSHVEVLTGIMWPSFAIVTMILDDCLRWYPSPRRVRSPNVFLTLGVMLLWMALPFSQLQRPGSAVLFMVEKAQTAIQLPFRRQLDFLDRLIADNKIRDFNVFTSAYQSQYYLRLPIVPTVTGINYHTVFFCDQLKEICRQMFLSESPSPFLLDMKQRTESVGKDELPRTADIVFDGFVDRSDVEKKFMIFEHGGYMLGIPSDLLLKGFDFSAFGGVRFESGDLIVSTCVPLADDLLAMLGLDKSPNAPDVIVERAAYGGITAVRFRK